MLDRRTLARINERPRGGGHLPILALGATLATAVLVAALLSYLAAAAVALVGMALAYFLRGGKAETVHLRYDELGGEAARRFAAVSEAVEALAGAEAVWSVEEEPRESVVVAGRQPVEVGRLDTPGFAADVEVWGIRAQGLGLFFLPECVLAREEGRYRAVSYDAFGALYRPARVAEDGEVPGDAEVVGETWRHTRPDGSPDPRYPSNPRYALVGYGLISATGLGVAGQAKTGEKPRTQRPTAGTTGLRLLVSNRAAAVRFARAFGAGRGAEREGEAASARAARARRNAEAEVERTASTYRLLGLEPGASRAEVAAAYKKKARMYHPDRVAHLAPEVREMAELRMKEINAAYGELKRRG